MSDEELRNATILRKHYSRFCNAVMPWQEKRSNLRFCATATPTHARRDSSLHNPSC